MDKVTGKYYKDYSYISRYAVFPYYHSKLDNKYFYGITSHLKKDTPYIMHKVKHNDTLDSLSLYYYNNPTYYWIIAQYNDIQDAYASLNVGQSLKIPTFSSIEFKLE